METNSRGSLKVIVGPMFSGKSTEMVREVDRYRVARRRTVIIRYADDNRYEKQEIDGGIMLNSGQLYTKSPILRAKTLESVNSIVASEYDVVGVSEIQFFPDIEYLDIWANEGKLVIGEGLNGRTDRVAMGRMSELYPWADDIVKLKAICELCSNEASFTTLRHKADQPGVKIGGAETYYPVCRKCYLIKNQPLV